MAAGVVGEDDRGKDGRVRHARRLLPSSRIHRRLLPSMPSTPKETTFNPVTTAPAPALHLVLLLRTSVPIAPLASSLPPPVATAQISAGCRDILSSAPSAPSQFCAAYVVPRAIASIWCRGPRHCPRSTRIWEPKSSQTYHRRESCCPEPHPKSMQTYHRRRFGSSLKTMPPQSTNTTAPISRRNSSALASTLQGNVSTV